MKLSSLALLSAGVVAVGLGACSQEPKNLTELNVGDNVVGQVNCENKKFRLDSSAVGKEFADKWYTVDEFAKDVQKQKGFGGAVAKLFYEAAVTEACD